MLVSQLLQELRCCIVSPKQRGGGTVEIDLNMWIDIFPGSGKMDYDSEEMHCGYKIAMLLYENHFHTELLKCFQKAPFLFRYFCCDGKIEEILDYYKITYLNLIVKNLKGSYTEAIGELYVFIYSDLPDDIAEKFPAPEDIGLEL